MATWGDIIIASVPCTLRTAKITMREFDLSSDHQATMTNRKKRLGDSGTGINRDFINMRRGSGYPLSAKFR